MSTYKEEYITNKHTHKTSIVIEFEGNKFEEEVDIICPNDNEREPNHIIVKNGKDTSTSKNFQQFLCRTCGRSFYAHTSRIFLLNMRKLPAALEEVFEGGKISANRLAVYFRIPKYTASRLIQKIVDHAAERMWNYPPFYLQTRRSSVMMADETFLTINGKLHYLIIAITEKQEVLGFKISSTRNKDVIWKFLSDCAHRLDEKLQVLITDGMGAYKAFARDWEEDIIHVRHFHKRPFNNVIFEIYHHDHGVQYLTSIKVKNDIFTKGRIFTSSVNVRRRHLFYKEYRPNIPERNWSAQAKELEKWIRRHMYYRNRQKKKKTFRRWYRGGFSVSLKKGRVKTSQPDLAMVAARLSILLPIFAGKHITTNLIENINLVIQKCIAFGVKRSEQAWNRYIEVCFTIRDQPQITKELFRDIDIPKQTLKRILPRLMEVSY